MMRNLLDAIPVVILGIIAILLVFQAIPDVNKEILLSIVSGLLGFIARHVIDNTSSGNNEEASPKETPQEP